MFKRLFWIGVGVTVGALAVIKAQAYVKANTPCLLYTSPSPRD